jgi:acyl-CoA dehydrogenase
LICNELQVVYGQLVLEQAALTGLDEDVLNELFAVLVRDFSAHAVELHGRPRRPNSSRRGRWSVRRPVVDESRTERVWQRVEALSGAYEMAP